MLFCNFLKVGSKFAKIKKFDGIFFFFGILSFVYLYNRNRILIEPHKLESKIILKLKDIFTEI